MSDDSFCCLVENSAAVVKDIGTALNIGEQQTINKISDFLKTKRLLFNKKA